jgi:O-succinylbenzoic acid--CoA ligase
LLHLDFSIEKNVINAHASDSYHQQVLTFCKRWLQGAQRFVFYTSGSTGKPKRVLIGRKRLEASAQATNATLNFSGHDHFLCCLPIQNIGGAMVLIRAMMAKATCTILEPSLSPLLSLPLQHTYTVASFVPAQLNDLNNIALRSKFEKIKTVLIGGAPILQHLENNLKQCKNQIYHTYGMTETVSHIALREIHLESAFHALSGINIQLNEEQCLCVQGIVTGGKWIVTNDIAELTDTHTFQIVGRKDFVINTGGVKVHADQVEAALMALLPNGADAIIVPTRDEQFGQVVTAIVSGIDENSPLLPSIQSELKSRLPPHHSPRKWVFVEQIPYTAAGKPDRRAMGG